MLDAMWFKEGSFIAAHCSLTCVICFKQSELNNRKKKLISNKSKLGGAKWGSLTAGWNRSWINTWRKTLSRDNCLTQEIMEAKNICRLGQNHWYRDGTNVAKGKEHDLYWGDINIA